MLEEFLHFLNQSPTAFHAAKNISFQLAEHDFTPLFEHEEWHLKFGQSYFVARENRLVAAFRIPKKKPIAANLLASHLDSPTLKLKPALTKKSDGIGQFSVEIYGAPLLHTWFDRDLAIAGELIAQNIHGEIFSETIFLDDMPIIIPDLGIHLQREVTEKGLLIQKQDHLNPIYALRSDNFSLEAHLKKLYPFSKLLGADLFLVPLEKANFIGFNNEMIASYRIDNLSSSFAILKALLDADSKEKILSMAFFWDHEEIGSTTYTGANSSFAGHLFDRILQSLKISQEEIFQLKARSFCLSCDAVHGYHPNFIEKYDSENTPYLGKGPVLKFSSKYASSAKSAAPIVYLAERQSIPLQYYASRSDIPSGGTVGAMMGANLGILTLDLGIPCWAMHSIRETMACQDQIWLEKLLKASLEEELLRKFENEAF